MPRLRIDVPSTEHLVTWEVTVDGVSVTPRTWHLVPSGRHHMCIGMLVMAPGLTARGTCEMAIEMTGEGDSIVISAPGTLVAVH